MSALAALALLMGSSGVTIASSSPNMLEDQDGDGVVLEDDIDDSNPNLCRDLDNDSCDDCSNTGADGSGGAVDNDGADLDGDGTCDAGDPDSDNDTKLDNDDSCPYGEIGWISESSTDHDSDGCRDDGEDTDDDNDTLPDILEVERGTSPRDADSDDDGVADGADTELNSDIDGDGLSNGLDPDSDNDGIADGTELGITTPGRDTDVAAGSFVPDADPSSTTNPLSSDSDHSGVDDGQEDSNKNGRVDDGELDPEAAGDDHGDLSDSDGDGLTDAEEQAAGTRPDDADSDDDGVLDGNEPNWNLDTDRDGLPNVLDPDSDNDGILDGTELGVARHHEDTNLAAGVFIPDADPSTTTSALNPDTDGGGVDDGAEDANKNGIHDGGDTDPNDPSDDIAPEDSDNDGLTDAEEIWSGTDENDADSDNDGVSDGEEPNWTVDTDGDGAINARDSDSDDDGVLDGTELGRTEPMTDTEANAISFVADADPATTTSAVSVDSDGGGVTDGVEDANGNGMRDPDETDPGLRSDDDPNVDSDGDNIPDVQESLGDPDGDGMPCYRDRDCDGDTILDADEAGDADLATLPLDSDGDGIPNHLDLDSDGDRILDSVEAGDSDMESRPADQDRDGLPDYLDRDSDGDGLLDIDEAGDHYLDSLPIDTDGDGIPNYLDSDSDADGIADGNDNCVLVENPYQDDLDWDGEGDRCESDLDGDGVQDADDNCPMWENAAQSDLDGDGRGDECDPDSDGDGFRDDLDVGGSGCSTTGQGSGSGAALVILVLLALLACRRREAAALGALALVMALSASPAQAQSAGDFPIERFRLAIDANGVLDVEWAAVPEHLSWDMALWLGTERDPLVVYGADGEAMGSLVSHRVASTLSAGLALWNRVQIGLFVPTVLSQSEGEIPGVMSSDLSRVGLGDVRIAPKVQLLHRRSHRVHLALIPSLTLPTGGNDSYLGENGVSFAPELAVSRAFGGVRLSSNLGYRLRRNTQLADLNVSDELFARLGVGFRVAESGGPPIEADLTLAAATTAASPFGHSNQDHLELSSGLAYRFSDILAAQVAGGVGIRTGFGTPDWRLVAGVRVRSPRRDNPAIGRARARLASRPMGRGDRGLAEAARIAREPEDSDARQHEPANADSEGADAEQDACAQQVENPQGLQDEHGCPAPDRDKDGVPDAEDLCVGELGLVENRGCPDVDQDGDSIVDRLDTCPYEPGTRENGGCQAQQLVVLRASKLEILDEVHFRTNKAGLRKRSHDLLRNVAQALQSHPDIRRLQIEVHTDNSLSAQQSFELSERRAERIMRFLIDEGIAPERLIAAGFGSSRPLSSNKTNAGRSKNRRVELIIVERGASKSAE